MGKALDQVEKFYDTLQTLPGLITKMALSVAEGQRQLDQNYIESLTAFLKIVSELHDDPTVEDYTSLMKSFAPSRYQFSETVAEVRADLQMTTLKEFKASVDIGVKASIFAVSVNASYSKRTGTDYRTSALIRTVINGIPSNEALLDRLLERGGEIPPHAELPSGDRYKALVEAFKELVKVLPPPTSPPLPS